MIFTGGGRGILKCSSGQESAIIQDLVSQAHQFGLDLRIGVSEKFSEAVVGAEDLYPFVPDSLEGEPCRASGLWPVTPENGCGFKSENKGIHPKIWERRQKIGKSYGSFDWCIIQELKEQENFPDELRDCHNLEFLTTVKADQDQDDEEMQERANRGLEVLGDRNRWAIVALDGNDMGSQFRAFEDGFSEKDENYRTTWYRGMSQALDECTREAFYHAMAEAIAEWWKNEGQWIYLDPSDESLVVLPFRPLILGGDDVLCLVHPSYAMDFARTLIGKFAELSKKKAESAKSKHGITDLWPGTNNELSISAGIAYTSVTQPLHMAIPYAESLLGSAKGKFRKDRQEDDGKALKKSTPAAIDWEHITETMIDTPAARRHRDLTFTDEDLGKLEIYLTERPYKVAGDLDRLLELKEQLKSYPRSLLVQSLEIFHLPWAKRMQRLAAMRKQNRGLVDKGLGLDLEKWDDETRDKKGIENHTRYAAFFDAVMLLEEEHRMEQETSQ